MTTLPRGIRQRGGSLMIDVTHKGRRATATVPVVGDDLKAALAVAKLRQMELRLALSGASSPASVSLARRSVWSLQQAVDYTMEHHWSGTRGEATAAINAKAAVTFFGPTLRLDEIDRLSIDRYVKSLREAGNSHGTINRKIAALSKVMKVARQCGGLVELPAFPRLREAQGRLRFLTPEEERTHLSLIKQWGKDDHHDAFVVLIDTGMRCGELFRLQVRDVDLKANLIMIWETKADLARSVPMTRRVRAVITRRMQGLTSTSRLFDYDKFWLRNTWDKVRDVMGFDQDREYIPHVLRHTCASRLVQRGVALKVVQEWLGHKSIITTMRYAKLAPANLHAAVSVLDTPDDLH